MNGKDRTFEMFKHQEYDILQFILIDGDFRGAVLGRVINGPYIIEDIYVDSGFENIRDEIIEAVYRVNSRERSPIKRYMGKELG